MKWHVILNSNSRLICVYQTLLCFLWLKFGYSLTRGVYLVQGYMYIPLRFVKCVTCDFILRTLSSHSMPLWNNSLKVSRCHSIISESSERNYLKSFRRYKSEEYSLKHTFCVSNNKKWWDFHHFKADMNSWKHLVMKYKYKSTSNMACSRK